MISRILFLVAVQILSQSALAAEPAQGDVPGAIGALRQRAIQAVDNAKPDTLYMSAKAQAWLDFAFEEYVERDATGVLDDALKRAWQLVGWLEAKQPEGVAQPEKISGNILLREDLWAALAEARRNQQVYPCAAPYLGRAEVQLLRAGHEQPELGMRHARRYIDDAERLLRVARSMENVCLKEEAARTAAAQAAQSAQVALSAQSAAAALTKAATAVAVARIPDSVHFAFDKADISPATDAILRNLADTMRAYPSLKVELAGHTDQIGNLNYNLKLSVHRVENVRQRLIELGLSRDRFSSRALGKSRLLLLQDSLDARARNRRVEFVVSDSSDPAGALRIETQQQESDLQPGEIRRQGG